MDGWAGETQPLRVTVKPRRRASALGAALHPLGCGGFFFLSRGCRRGLCVSLCVTRGDFPGRHCFGGACAGRASATELCGGTSARIFSRRPELVDARW